jgi:monolysocardiolipin acyltransferase
MYWTPAYATVAGHIAHVYICSYVCPYSLCPQNGRGMGPVRKGVGRLVAACGERPPLVVPFVHSGMEEVMPRGKALPNIGKKVG